MHEYRIHLFMLCVTHIISVGNLDTIYGSTFSIEIYDYLINAIIDKYILENIILLYVLIIHFLLNSFCYSHTY